MSGPKPKNPFASETPSRGQRVDALGERLSELRTKLGVLASDTAAESKSRASSHDTKQDAKTPSKRGAPLPPEASANDDEKLALAVFNTMKGDPRRLRQFVLSLARIEAAAAKHAAESVRKNEDKG